MQARKLEHADRMICAGLPSSLHRSILTLQLSSWYWALVLNMRFLSRVSFGKDTLPFLEPKRESTRYPLQIVRYLIEGTFCCAVHGSWPVGFGLMAEGIRLALGP